MSKIDPGRYGELDVLRGLAALSVVAFHYTMIYPVIYHPNEVMLFQFPWGMYGPYVFFMISGFVILMTLEKTKHPLDFIVSRFSRLFPGYWAAVIVTYLVTRYLVLFPSAYLQCSFNEFLCNFSMLEYWFKIRYVDGVYWTLEAELTFYLLIFLIYLSKGLKYIEIFGIFWLAIMTAYHYLPLSAPLFISFKTAFSSLLRYGNFFVAGIIFYNLKIKGNKWYRYLGLVLCLLVSNLWQDQVEVIVLGLAMVFFYLFILGKLTFIAQRPLVYLGTISYSLYLVHCSIGYTIKGWLRLFSLNPFLNFFIPLACCMLLATLITYLIEKPAMKVIRGAYKNLNLFEVK